MVVVVAGVAVRGHLARGGRRHLAPLGLRQQRREQRADRPCLSDRGRWADTGALGGRPEVDVPHTREVELARVH
eukprot:4233342-Alexandrium_andersonii.AAC.1